MITVLATTTTKAITKALSTKINKVSEQRLMFDAANDKYNKSMFTRFNRSNY